MCNNILFLYIYKLFHEKCSITNSVIQNITKVYSKLIETEKNQTHVRISSLCNRLIPMKEKRIFIYKELE